MTVFGYDPNVPPWRSQGRETVVSAMAMLRQLTNSTTDEVQIQNQGDST
jgi:hypothetical protein